MLTTLALGRIGDGVLASANVAQAEAARVVSDV
jgi:hypothetical protein